MAHSMTGFARCSAETDAGRWVLEVSALNSRFLEAHCFAPASAGGFEQRVVRALRRRVHRGKVTFRLTFEPTAGTALWDTERLTEAYLALKEAAWNLEAPMPRIEALLSFAGGTSPRPADEEVLDRLTEQALQALQADRAREGEALVKALREKAEAYRDLMARIEELWKKGKEAAFAAWRGRVQAAVEALGVQPDEAVLATELTVAADRWDVTEELVRTGTHITHLFELLEAEGPVGRKLDFLLQELNREINTLGSKVNDQDVRWLVVEGKSLLENLREQVQNLE